MNTSVSSTIVIGSRFVAFNANYFHQQCGFYLGIALYCVYIFLIVKKSTKVMQPYKKVLLFHCILDLLYIFQNLILHGEYPCVTTPGGRTCFLMVTAIFVYPPRFFVWLSEAWNAAMVCWHVPGIALIFLYRYFLICRSYQFTIRMFSLCALLSLLIPFAIYLAVQGYLLWPKDSDMINEPYLSTPEWLYEGRVPTFVVYPPNLTVWNRTGHIIPSYFAIAVILYTTYSINKALNSLQNRSKKAKRIQAEMTVVLWIQAILPFISHIIPFTTIMIKNIFSFDSSFIYYFTKASVWAPAINVVLSIFIIGPYRNFIRGFFLFCYRNEGSPSVSETSVASITNRVTLASVSRVSHK